MTEYLNGFNYADYLKRHLMVGQVDPWRRTEEGKPMYALLVPFQNAYDECLLASKEKISKIEFSNQLKMNDILIFRNTDEFVRIKENLKYPQKETQLKLKKDKTPRKPMSEERKKELQERAKSWNKEKKTLHI